MDDADRTLRAHDRDLGRRPGEVHVAADVLAAHDVVGTAVRLARDDRQLRNGRLGVGVQQLRAVTDDPAMFLVDTGQETRHVDERHQRDVEGIACPDEPRGLDRRIDVEGAGEDGRLLRDDPDAAPAESREPDDDVLRPAGLDLQERGVVDDATQDVMHVIRQPRVVGDDRVELGLHPVGRIGRVDASRASRDCSGAGARAAPSPRQAHSLRRAPRCARRRCASCASRAPPRNSRSTSSCVTVLTTSGPVTNM